MKTAAQGVPHTISWLLCVRVKCPEDLQHNYHLATMLKRVTSVSTEVHL